jgi:hypothetical protein
MDTQTILALAIVLVAAVVLARRIIVATKRNLSQEGCVSSGCGGCSGCPSRSKSSPGNSPKDRGERELVLVALQKNLK